MSTLASRWLFDIIQELPSSLRALVLKQQQACRKLSPQAKLSKQFGLLSQRRLLEIQKHPTTWAPLAGYILSSSCGHGHLGIKAREADPPFRHFDKQSSSIVFSNAMRLLYNFLP